MSKDKYVLKEGDYVRHKFRKEIRGVITDIGESGIECHLRLHSGVMNFISFTGNLKPDLETYREHKIKKLLCEK